MRSFPALGVGARAKRLVNAQVQEVSHWLNGRHSLIEVPAPDDDAVGRKGAGDPIVDASRDPQLDGLVSDETLEPQR